MTQGRGGRMKLAWKAVSFKRLKRLIVRRLEKKQEKSNGETGKLCQCGLLYGRYHLNKPLADLGQTLAFGQMLI